jgi:16S rRNA (cytosine967-C5)-methyltransferase
MTAGRSGRPDSDRSPGDRRSGGRRHGEPSARSVALGVIRRVVERGGYSNLALRSALDRSGLSSADRALATELVYGTLRRLLSLDREIAARLDRPIERTSPGALALLRLGTYQLRHTRIPPHAAVSETVALAGSRERGLVNAVLRRIAAEPALDPGGASDEDVSVRTGLAEWAVRELRAQLGPDAELAAAALGEPAPVTVRTNTCRTSVEELRAALERAGVASTPGAVHAESLVLAGGSPSELPGFQLGWFAVQDQASSFVVSALGARPGERVVDVCAGPGGKAGHLACVVSPGGVTVAADVSPIRAALVRAHVGRLRVSAHVLVQDARRPALRGGFARVLVDAPCSGLGAARRRPELLWRPRAEGPSALGRLQLEIAAASADLLAPNGRLVYSVCTFPRAETDEVCDALLRARPDLVPETINGPDGPGERVRLWPHRHGTDAMFVAAFRRARVPHG